jgi:hypothetical protein
MTQAEKGDAENGKEKGGEKEKEQRGVKRPIVPALVPESLQEVRRRGRVSGTQRQASVLPGRKRGLAPSEGLTSLSSRARPRVGDAGRQRGRGSAVRGEAWRVCVRTLRSPRSTWHLALIRHPRP